MDPATNVVLKSFSYDNISIEFKNATELQIFRNGKVQNVEFYEKKGEFFVFDREGNCYRNINKLDEVARETETVVDT